MVAAIRLEISVEEAVCGGLPVVPQEIHQGKGKIVEQIDRGDRRIELDRVEQDRFVLDQDDVRQMQVAMATPYIPFFAALLEQPANP